jgi:hypothetical protein
MEDFILSHMYLKNTLWFHDGQLGMNGICETSRKNSIAMTYKVVMGTLFL